MWRSVCHGMMFAWMLHQSWASEDHEYMTCHDGLDFGLLMVGTLWDALQLLGFPIVYPILSKLSVVQLANSSLFLLSIRLFQPS